jgi:type II secretion system protein G
MNKLRGFTLIELLIVVAIIAILAAIAVPNFLEAQTRSKVSRVLADMRSIKTGVESYRVDNNRYPEGRDCTDITKAGYPEGLIKHRLVLITTPIAYMTSLPDDPFLTRLGTNVPCDEPSFVYLLHKYHTWFSGGEKVWSLGGRVSNADDWVLWPRSVTPEYILLSKGPYKGDVSAYTTTIYAIPYDPTNGTVSFGEIVAYGPG